MLRKLSLGAGLFALATVATPQSAPAASAPQSLVPPKAGVTLVYGRRYCSSDSYRCSSDGYRCSSDTYRSYHSDCCWHTVVRTCCASWFGERWCKTQHRYDNHCDW